VNRRLEVQIVGSPPDSESPTALRERACALYVPGVVGTPQIAKLLGVSRTTVLRWVNSEYAEQERVRSREAKRRRTGTCALCGGVTRYAGHGKVVSDTCETCNNKPWTHCAKGHELSGENDLRGRDRAWTCRICRNAYMREYSHRRRREAGVPERGPYLTRRLHRAETPPGSERTQ